MLFAGTLVGCGLAKPVRDGTTMMSLLKGCGHAELEARIEQKIAMLEARVGGGQLKTADVKMGIQLDGPLIKRERF